MMTDQIKDVPLHIERMPWDAAQGVLVSCVASAERRLKKLDIFHANHVVKHIVRYNLFTAMAQMVVVDLRMPPSVMIHAMQLFDRWTSTVGRPIQNRVAVFGAAGALVNAIVMDGLDPRATRRHWPAFSETCGVTVTHHAAARASTHVLVALDFDAGSSTPFDALHALLLVLRSMDPEMDLFRRAAHMAMVVATVGSHISRWAAFRPVDVANTIVITVFNDALGRDITKGLAEISATTTKMWYITPVASTARTICDHLYPKPTKPPDAPKPGTSPASVSSV